MQSTSDDRATFVATSISRQMTVPPKTCKGHNRRYKLKQPVIHRRKSHGLSKILPPEIRLQDLAEDA